MARETILINDKEFRTKKAAMEHFRALLARSLDGVPIEGEDEADLLWLLARHPEVTTKVGVGLDHFYADQAYMGTRCFHVRRLDGSGTDFSFKSCIDGRSPTPQQEFLEAARTAVQQDIGQAKRRHYDEHKTADGTVPCELSGRSLRFEDAHVDHAEPMTFEVIVQAFLVAQRIDDPSVHITNGEDNQYVAKFKDPPMINEFREFHRKLARLRWVSRAKNLSLGAKHHLRHRRSTVKL